jgi:hypothetical protein
MITVVLGSQGCRNLQWNWPAVKQLWWLVEQVPSSCCGSGPPEQGLELGTCQTSTAFVINAEEVAEEEGSWLRLAVSNRRVRP